MFNTGRVRFPAVSVLLILSLTAGPAVAARPLDAPSSIPAVARAEYNAALAAATKIHRDSVRAAESAYKEALRLAGTREAVVQAQAKALAAHATLAQEARDRHAPAIAAAMGRERKLAQQALDRELAEIERATTEALKVARRLSEPKFAREYAEKVRSQSLAAAALVLQEAKRVALARLNEVLIRQGLPPVTG